jgi:hypothetical protein
MKIEICDGDAVGFIETVEICAKGILTLASPDEFVLVRINNWFGPKWLPFSARQKILMQVYKQRI